MVKRSLLVVSLLFVAGCVDGGERAAVPEEDGVAAEASTPATIGTIACTSGETLSWSADDWWIDGERPAKRPVYPDGGVPPELVLDACRLSADQFANR